MHRKTRLLLCTCLLFCAFFAFCTVAQARSDIVPIKNYSPKFTTDLSEYKGKRVYLMNFDNQARDTTVWYYFSPDGKFAYGSSSLIHNYFWYSFERALISLGMWVSNMDKPDPYAPAVWMTLKSITDANFIVELKLQKFIYGVSFTKTYTVAGEELPVNAEQRTREYLEKRAYNMTNKLFETILNDPEFKKTFLKAVADMAPSRVK